MTTTIYVTPHECLLRKLMSSAVFVIRINSEKKGIFYNCLEPEKQKEI